MQSILSPTINSYHNIDWVLIGMAKQYYEKLGYEYIETPWIVPTIYTNKTKPTDNKSYVLDSDIFQNQNHELVGSAEQGFLYLIGNEKLKSGKYCSISPCFRVDDYDSLHQLWFLKLELINFMTEEITDVNNILVDAHNFFKQNTKGNLEVITLLDGSQDIHLNDIEIGSYGMRKMNKCNYVYGTGLALPRFSIASGI